MDDIFLVSRGGDGSLWASYGYNLMFMYCGGLLDESYDWMIMIPLGPVLSLSLYFYRCPLGSGFLWFLVYRCYVYGVWHVEALYDYFSVVFGECFEVSVCGA